MPYPRLLRLAALFLGVGSLPVLAVEPAAPDAKLLTAQATALEHGEGVPRDTEKAAALYCEAARLGDAGAQFNLGWMYANGRGLSRDDALAAFFFGLAAKQGMDQAKNMLRFVGEAVAAPPECMKDKAEEISAPEGASPERKQVVEMIRKLAPEYAISPSLALAVVTVESNFQASARSGKNAQGLMQLIPETAERFKVRNAFDPVQNLRGGLAYLRWLLAYFQGDVALAAAGYNAGEGAVDKYQGIPPYQETRAYVQRILELFPKREHPFDPLITDPSPHLPRIRAKRLQG
ncbi:MAG: transglycosylase SLT domain-containing protein [Rhodocyclaceae bacterium]|nr:transglycosylase SLT domain-containing protein [Rhodocyclaceae bacterium]